MGSLLGEEVWGRSKGWGMRESRLYRREVLTGAAEARTVAKSLF